LEKEHHRYEDVAEDTDPDYTTPSVVGDDTTDGTAEDATTEDGGAHTDASQPKRQRTDRRPNVLGPVREEFTEVSSKGHPMVPKELVKGYAVHLGCILRSTASINTKNLRHKDRGNLPSLLFTKMHERYKFPADFANTRLSGNKLNSAALTRMSTTLSTWRSTVKAMIDKGGSYDKIKVKYPLMSDDDYKEFKIKCESPATSESSQWGREMR